MKKLLKFKPILITLVGCLLLMGLATSVLAEENQQEPGPGLEIEEEVLVYRPHWAEAIPVKQSPASIQPPAMPGVMIWSTLLSENFDGGFTGTGGWGADTFRSFSGAKSGYPGENGADSYDPRTSYYKNNMFSWLGYGPFDFSAVTNARLEFQVWLDSEYYNDGLFICASADHTLYSCVSISGLTDGWDFFSHTLENWLSLGSSLMGDPDVWIALIFSSNEAITGPGVFIDDLVVRSTSSTPEPDVMLVAYDPQPNLFHPGDSFHAQVEIMNMGASDCTGYTLTQYLSPDAIVTTDDIEIYYANYSSPSILPGEHKYYWTTPTIPAPTTPGIYYLGAIIGCFEETEYGNNVAVYPNPIEITNPGVGGIIFSDGFESADLTSWTRFNPGKVGLSANNEASQSGDFGAYFYRPPGNDKRRQLIDETPVDQTTFNVRFDFDINGLSMKNGERFRFMQVKMGAERPYFIVLKFDGSNYWIQLNTKLNDFSKDKTGWYLLSDAPHTIEVDWWAASGSGAFDGYAALYIDDVIQEELDGLDSDTLYVDTFKLGYTSRLEGKSFSGAFYVDNVVTSSGGHIGYP